MAVLDPHFLRRSEKGLVESRHIIWYGYSPTSCLKPSSFAKTIFSCTIDPMWVSTSSHTLLEHDALGMFITELSHTRHYSPRTRARLRGSCKTDTRLVSLRAMQIQTRPPCFRWPPFKTSCMRRATCALAIRLKSVRVMRGAMLLSDVETTADATTALGDLRVDTMVWCTVARTFGILFRVAAAS